MCELKDLWRLALLFDFELQIIKVMAKTNINATDEFEIGEEGIAVFFPNQVFDEGMLDKEKFFILYHAEDNNNQPNFPYRKHVQFGLELLVIQLNLSDHISRLDL